MNNLDGLIIKKPWIDKILSGEKTWELRGSATHKRGQIALIESGSGLVVGEVKLVNCLGPLTQNQFESNVKKHCSSHSFLEISYKKVYAWVFEKPFRYKEPKPYKHPPGAIIWVKL